MPEKKKKHSPGFSLIELAIYIAIFVVSAVFLTAILTAVTRVQLRQKSYNEVNHQISFVGNTIERLVQESSVIDISAGTATSSLVLRLASSSLDPTSIYSSSTAIYLQEGTSTPIALTDSKINVDNFSVTKYENPSGKAIVQVSMAFSFNTSNDKAKFNRAVQLAIARVSAASFDSDIIPNATNSYDLGNSTYNWKSAYFAGSIGVGVNTSAAAKIKSSGDIAIASSTAGLILMSPNSTCYRVTITNAGAFSTSSVSCP